MVTRTSRVITRPALMKPVHLRQRYQGKSRGRPRSQVTGWTGTGLTGTRSDSPSPRRRGSRSTSSAPWCVQRPAWQAAGWGVLAPCREPFDSGVSCWSGRATEMHGSSRAGCKILPLRRRTQGGRDTPAHPPDKPSPVTSHSTLRPGFASARPAGDQLPYQQQGWPTRSSVQVAGPGRSDGVGVKRQGCRTRLLAQPQAPGIPGAGPGRWPARPP